MTSRRGKERGDPGLVAQRFPCAALLDAWKKTQTAKTSLCLAPFFSIQPLILFFFVFLFLRLNAPDTTILSAFPPSTEVWSRRATQFSLVPQWSTPPLPASSILAVIMGPRSSHTYRWGCKEIESGPQVSSPACLRQFNCICPHPWSMNSRDASKSKEVSEIVALWARTPNKGRGRKKNQIHTTLGAVERPWPFPHPP